MSGVTFVYEGPVKLREGEWGSSDGIELIDHHVDLAWALTGFSVGERTHAGYLDLGRLRITVERVA